MRIQGKAVLYDLSQSNEVKEVICADANPEALGTFRDFLDMKKIKVVKIDASDKKALTLSHEARGGRGHRGTSTQFVKNVFEACD